MGSTQQGTFPITEARVISTASPPLEKSKPKTRLILALSILGGLGLGVGLAILRDTMDRVFRTAKQIEAELHEPFDLTFKQMSQRSSLYPSRDRFWWEWQQPKTIPVAYLVRLL